MSSRPLFGSQGQSRREGGKCESGFIELSFILLTTIVVGVWMLHQGPQLLSTPHTSPESRFLTTEEKWKRNLESTIFGTQPPLLPHRKLEELL